MNGIRGKDEFGRAFEGIRRPSSVAGRTYITFSSHPELPLQILQQTDRTTASHRAPAIGEDQRARRYRVGKREHIPDVHLRAAFCAARALPYSSSSIFTCLDGLIRNEKRFDRPERRSPRDTSQPSAEHIFSRT
ncbi:hypothetical protein RB213_009089 [Colletotrichum asianum]